MQLSFAEFKDYLRADMKARRRTLGLASFCLDPIVRFHWYMRGLEFLQDRAVLLPLFLLTKTLFLWHSRSLGFSIPINTVGKGVYFPHYGTIVINSRAWVGEGSTVNVDVVIGKDPDSESLVPTIGRNVYIGPGAKIFGQIEIGANSKIGANAVVNKSFPEDATLIGVPAKNITK